MLTLTAPPCPRWFAAPCRMVKTHVQINGKDKLNLASFNLLGLVGNERIQVVRAALRSSTPPYDCLLHPSALASASRRQRGCERASLTAQLLPFCAHKGRRDDCLQEVRDRIMRAAGLLWHNRLPPHTREEAGRIHGHGGGHHLFVSPRALRALCSAANTANVRIRLLLTGPYRPLDPRRAAPCLAPSRYGFATISSVIPAYCKRGDIIY